MKLSACVLVVAALTLPAAQASPSSLVPGLLYTPGYGNSIVTLYDPQTLARSGTRIRLGGNANSWSWSPRRRYVAVASYPQRLTVLDVATMRVVARIELARGGGIVRGVTWARRNRVLALIETPDGVVVSVVDTVARRVVSRALIPRTVALEFERVPGGLLFLLRPRNRVGPAELGVVDADGRLRVATVAQARAGIGVRASGAREQQDPGLAVDLVGRKAYVVGGDRIFVVDLRTLAVSDPGPVRTLAKGGAGATRSAEWLGNGLLAVSGTNWDVEDGDTPAGLKIVDVRAWTARVVDRSASNFTLTGGLLLVERAASRRELEITAYELDGSRRYQRELAWTTWLKKPGRLGYACRDAFLRSVIDLASGRTLRDGFSAGTRCPTLLTGDSRG